jgi:hypothetical protein
MRSNKKISQFQVGLTEVELTANTGDHARMETVVTAMMRESAPQGLKALDTAARILLRDCEFRQLANLCERVLALPSAPAAARLLKGRALTMLGDFNAAQAILSELEQDPSGLNEDMRAQLANWADQARRYPTLLQITAKPDVRDRLDIARILAVSGAKPDIWLSLFIVNPAVSARMGKNILAGDYVLQAMGCARKAEDLDGLSAQNFRSRAVQCLIDAFEAGFLNRTRVLKDPLLAPLTRDSRVAKFFVTR